MDPDYIPLAQGFKMSSNQSFQGHPPFHPILQKSNQFFGMVPLKLFDHLHQ
jgi:hypothetical protein